MNELYKVSVIVATYRREQELTRALVSLAEQDFDGFEIILVDDNADPAWNEKVLEVSRDFQIRFPMVPLTYVRNAQNLGSAETRNQGAAVARGEYITFLDDDDVYFSQKISAQYAFMRENELDYSVTDLDLYYDDETLSEHRTRGYLKMTDRDSLLRYHLLHRITGTDTLMLTKAYFKRIGGFPPVNVGDEFYLVERAILGEGAFGYLQRCDVKAYVHRGGGGLSSGEQKIEGEKRIYAYKKRYYHLLDKKSIRYIRMRHHAVLAFAYLRMKRMGRFFTEAVCAFIVSPVAGVRLFRERKNRT